MDNSIVRQLLSGSENIDRTRKEVDMIVKMILGMITPNDISRWEIKKWPKQPLGQHFEETFRSPECEWVVRLSGRQLEVTCNLIFQLPHPRESKAYVESVYSSDFPQINLWYVKQVHECLYVFVEGISSTFPRINECWGPLLDAASNN